MKTAQAPQRARTRVRRVERQEKRRASTAGWLDGVPDARWDPETPRPRK